MIFGIISALNFSLKNKLLKKDYQKIINHIHKSKFTKKIKKIFFKKKIQKNFVIYEKDKKNNTE